MPKRARAPRSRRRIATSAAANRIASPASEKKIAPRRDRGARELPSRGEFLVRDAFVMTMDPDLGDLPGGDVHVKNGEIIAIGQKIKAPRAAILDGSGMIALPGLVETHWHMWNTLLRSFSGDTPARGYFPTSEAFGQAMTPGDMYQGTRLAAAEALYSGITTVHDYCHNVRSHQHAEASLRALRESGLRARWSYGWAQGQPNTQIIDLDDLARLHRNWTKYSNGGLISLGLGWRGMFRFTPMPLEVAREEFETARRLGIPISVHVGGRESATGQIEAHARENFLGKDVQLLHAVSASPAEIQMVAAAGSPVSVSPGSELRIGYGFPKTGEFLSAGVTVGVSVDTTALTGNANFLGALKLVRDIENAKSHNEFQMSARRALELGTIEGARSLGIDDRAGSLAPGKRADLIMVSTRHVNMGVFTDPANLLVEAAEAANVDTVMVDGRLLKRGGELTALAVDEVIEDANTTFDAVRKRANWPAPAWPHAGRSASGI